MSAGPRAWIVFDTEGATAHGAPHLLELGAVRVVDGEAVDHFESLVLPRVPIEPEATAIHGLTEDDVRTAPLPDEVLRAFHAWAGGDALAAWHAPADARVLAFEHVRCALEPPTTPIADLLPPVRRAFPELPDHKLATLKEHFELEGTDHRALADAVTAWQVFERAAAELGAPDPTALFATGGPAGILNLKTAAPRPPKLGRATVRVLERAWREGRDVRLSYGEHRSSASLLDVRPTILYRTADRSYLEGECLRSGSIKTYRIDRIHRVEPAAR